jgi:hypothetical protein
MRALNDLFRSDSKASSPVSKPEKTRVRDIPRFAYADYVPLRNRESRGCKQLLERLQCGAREVAVK